MVLIKSPMRGLRLCIGRLARNFDLIFSTLRLERDYVDAADRRLTQLTGCRRARKGVQCLFLALFCRANRAERCPVSGGDLNRSTQHLLILLDKEVADGDVTDIVHGEAEG
jgi:hypothetical protein